MLIVASFASAFAIRRHLESNYFLTDEASRRPNKRQTYKLETQEVKVCVLY